MWTVSGDTSTGIIEAIGADSANRPNWILGIQWHPGPAFYDKTQHEIFKALVERARKVRAHRR